MIEQVAEKYPVEAACKATGISRSGYYAHKKKPERTLRKGDAELKPKIRQVLDRSRGTYGTPRIRIELAREGKRHGRRRIARLMNEQGLKARNKRQWRRSGTTVTDPALAIAPNYLGQIPHSGFHLSFASLYITNQGFQSALQYMRVAVRAVMGCAKLSWPAFLFELVRVPGSKVGWMQATRR